MLPAVINAEAEAKMRRAQRLIAQAGEAVASLAADLSSGVQTPVKDDVKAAHRREHRMGVPGKIESDPELEAFVIARIATQTYAEIVADVKAHFPAGRQISTSGVQRWFRKRNNGGAAR